MKISLVIPSRNNLKYVKFAYESIRTHLGPDVEVILLDDASTDGTWEWMRITEKQYKNVKIHRNGTPDRVGHCILYDVGAKMASNEVFGIFHADMVAIPGYVENMTKYLKRGTIVSATRIEPPLHPTGIEKVVSDNFPIEPEEYSHKYIMGIAEGYKESLIKNGIYTTKGIFAPWIMYKDDFFAIGGHDKRVFSPMELEDSDLFNRFLLKGYEMIQSREAFVYHFTCRGSRFKDGIQIVQEIPLGNGHVWKRAQDSEEYTKLRQNKFREWWRKWHMDVLHNQNMLPIVNPRYDTGFVIKNCPYDLIQFLEPWCDNLFIENPVFVAQYITQEQPHTKFDLSKRILPLNSDHKQNDVTITFDGTQFTQQHMGIIKQLPLMIKDSGEIGFMEFDIFTLDIRSIVPIEERLIHADNPWYVEQLYGSH